MNRSKVFCTYRQCLVFVPWAKVDFETPMQLEELDRPAYVICSECSALIPFEGLSEEALECERCGHKTSKYKPKSLSFTLAFSITALALYFPANFFPFMSMELYGNRSNPTIWEGVVDLVSSGSWFIGIVVFLASMVLPLLKLLVLFSLAANAHLSKRARLKTKVFRVTESIGRWSMLDIFLLAILIAVMKLGPWTSVAPELGSVLFGLVVIFTMLASASFDTRLLWSPKNEE